MLLTSLSLTLAASCWTDNDPSRFSVATRTVAERSAGRIEVKAIIREDGRMNAGALNFHGFFTRSNNTTDLSLKEVMEKCFCFGHIHIMGEGEITYLSDWLYEICTIMKSNILVEFRIKNGENNYTPFMKIISLNADDEFSW